MFDVFIHKGWDAEKTFTASENFNIIDRQVDRIEDRYGSTGQLNELLDFLLTAKVSLRELVVCALHKLVDRSNLHLNLRDMSITDRHDYYSDLIRNDGVITHTLEDFNNGDYEDI